MYSKHTDQRLAVLELEGQFNVSSKFAYEGCFNTYVDLAFSNSMRVLIRLLIACKQARSDASQCCLPGEKEAFEILEDPMFHFWL